MTFSASEVLAELLPFQQRTVDAALCALYRGPNARFLVADEVGLGKTRVARGVIARMREERERRGETGLRVVYLSSSLAIAKQNAPLLRCGGDDAVFSAVDRVTMLPTELKPDAALEVLAFTPGTSLSMGGRRTGTARERALLGRLLSSAGLAGPIAGRRERLIELLGPPAIKSFPELFDRALSRFPNAVIRPFQQRWSVHPLACELRAHIGGTRLLLPERRREVIGELRHVLAEACIDLLGAHLIVVDEFQRFMDALDAELAVRLLSTAPALFLSATPFTDTSTDSIGLLRLVATLDPANPGRVANLESALTDLRHSLLIAGTDSGASAREAKTRVEELLSPLIARTERRSSSRNVVDPHAIRVALDVDDIHTFAELDDIGRRVGQPGVVGYWKSAAHPLNFMDDYELARRARRTRDWPSMRLTKAMLKAGSLPPGNPATRGLLQHVADEGHWNRPWVAPSLPYVDTPAVLRDTGPATKLLVFTAWTVAPKAIASMVSHDVRTTTRRRSRTSSRPLQVRPDGPMTELTALLPSTTLACLINPVDIIRRNAHKPMAWDQLRRRAVNALHDRIPPPRTMTGAVDRRWYVVAPLLMDGNVDWMWQCEGLAWSGRRAELADLVAHPEQLGRPPRDLPLVLAETAFAPAASVLRALLRHFPDHADEGLIRHAALIADSFRSLLEQPESLALARRLAPREKHWWRRVLRLCVMADLSAVVDEHLSALISWAPSASSEDDDVERVARAFREALNLPAVPLGIHVPGGSGRATMTTRAAMRIPTANASAEERDHVERLRLAFNSPFPPFVLATTSVGQEGLDFHLWCHAVVHWNLPRSPIVFEQREGRIDRYRGHVQRRNLAEAHRAAAFASDGEPWSAMWQAGTEAARSDTSAGDGMSPSWVSTGPHKIQRHLPHLPLSAEDADTDPLLRRVARYRLTLGQPDPEQLLEVLSENDAIDEALARDLVIDLTPRGTRKRKP